ncbi:sporulation-specific protein 22 [Saxophila tyrrhenica]|uniref:Sporulation-specific protein 22 n=1 Tax=Saxophila tyrrhenica TaxID=1690608 RepID=A0AAV9PRJ8_9PEZI|nr:sporulation-specific protein 22 [Saxophila tyrrhenica]
MAIAKSDFEGARSAYYEMPPGSQNESVTRYLAFKLAIRTDDYNFATESLQVILRGADRDATFLYACALEAQQSQMRHIAIAALQAILDKQPPGVHLPSLLRCIARLLLGELDAPSRNQEDVAQEIVRVFETAAQNLAALKQGSGEQWRTELQWWSKNAYNISLKLCGQIHPELLVRLLQACCRFVEVLPQDGGRMHNDDLSRRELICHFLAAAALIALGRSNEEGSEYGLQSFLQARQEISAFKATHNKLANHSDADNASRSFQLQKFDLECILNLQQWDDVAAAFQSCLDFERVDDWDALADIVLIIHQKSANLSEEANSRMMELLDRIINETWQKGKEIVKAARWLRLSFSLDLNDGDGSLALKLLAQAARMAKRQRDRRGHAFPETELQWLATTSFNRAIDLLSAGANEACMEWIEGALGLARWAGDTGALHKNLSDRKELVARRMREVVV